MTHIFDYIDDALMSLLTNISDDTYVMQHMTTRYRQQTSSIHVKNDTFLTPNTINNYDI